MSKGRYHIWTGKHNNTDFVWFIIIIVIWGFGKAHNPRQDRVCFLFNNVSVLSISFFNGAFVSPKYYYIYCGTGYLWRVMSINWLIIFTCRKLVLDAETSIFFLSIANFIIYYKHRLCVAIVSFENDNIMIVDRIHIITSIGMAIEIQQI